MKKTHIQISKADIEAIGLLYGILNIESIQPLSGGLENTNYLIHTKKQPYVLCLFEQKSYASVQGLAKLLEYLKTQQYSTTEVIATSAGESILTWQDKPIMMKSYIPGKPIQDLSPKLLTMLGKQLGRLHCIEPPSYLPHAPSYGQHTFDLVSHYAAGSRFSQWLRNIQDYLSPYLDLELPQSLIHSDLFWDNVIVSDQEDALTIMDFEEAARYYRIFDLGMTIIGTCAEGQIINLIKAKHLIAGYQENISLLDLEKKSLKAFTIYAGTSMTFWRHQNFNHTKPNPELADHYLGLQVLVDDLMGQPDDCFM